MQSYLQQLFLIACICLHQTSQSAAENAWKVTSLEIASVATTVISVVTCGYLAVKNCQQKKEIETLRSPTVADSPVVACRESSELQERIDAITHEREALRELSQRSIHTLVHHMFALSPRHVARIVADVPEALKFKDRRNRNLLHHAMMRHHIPLFAAIIKHPSYAALLSQVDNDGRTPQHLVSHQKDGRSLLEDTYTTPHVDQDARIRLCKVLVDLSGECDYSASRSIFGKSSLKSFKEQHIYLEVLRIGQNEEGGCMICLDSIESEDNTLLDCCYTCLHHSCLQENRKHKNMRCPKCNNPHSATITHAVLRDQEQQARGLQIAFSQ